MSIDWPTPAQVHLTARKPIAPRWMLWLDIKTLAGDPFSAGFWTGEYHETLTVEAQSRLYYGAQGALQIPAISYSAGTEIRSYEVAMSVSPEAETVVRGYNTRFGGAELHCALFDPADWSLLGIRRFFRGFIDGQPIYTPAVGGVGRIALKLVSSARRGTMTRNGRKSHESQIERHPGDEFRLYGDLGSTLGDPWGTR